MKYDSQSLISIIIPVYGGEKYIHECVDSVLNQSYQNIECILVDGASPDNCPGICDDYAVKDKRVKVLHKKNRGLSDDRNAGVKLAKGEYIAFVDVDDILASEMIEMLYFACKKNSVRVALGNYTRDKGIFERNKQKGKICLLTANKCIAGMYGPHSILFIVSWGKLFHRSVLEAKQFPLNKAHEDEYTTHYYYDIAKKIVLVDKPLYYYRVNNNSLMAKERENPNIDGFKALYERGEYLKRKGYEKELAIHLRVCAERIRKFCVDNHTKMSSEQKKYCKKMYREYFWRSVKNGEMSVTLQNILFYIK